MVKRYMYYGVRKQYNADSLLHAVLPPSVHVLVVFGLAPAIPASPELSFVQLPQENPPAVPLAKVPVHTNAVLKFPDSSY